MLFMLFFRLRENKYVIKEDNDKLFQILHEHFIHEVHKISRCVGQPKRHDRILIQTISTYKSSFGYVRSPNLQLMVTRPKINLGEEKSSSQLVKQTLNVR